ncbi:uncharacterized protein LOC115684725 [Syzygium oleosum]|uniref:uncharacterized protein LOC115684725 n=1 Tax=Syzygium oleosum TaxID=219896 RepID=UPI0024B9FCE6|nr:uncharacterized protein LOC115684725 [Syzygium oleosum]
MTKARLPRSRSRSLALIFSFFAFACETAQLREAGITSLCTTMTFSNKSDTSTTSPPPPSLCLNPTRAQLEDRGQACPPPSPSPPQSPNPSEAPTSSSRATHLPPSLFSFLRSLALQKLHAGPDQTPASRAAERLVREWSVRFTYLAAAAAAMSGFGITFVTVMAVMAVSYRFAWQMEGGQVPLSEMFGAFALSVGAAVVMVFWARWAHRALWHASPWPMHEPDNRPRGGELDDVFAIINAVPAIALLSYGFFHKGLVVPGLRFGAGLGITVFRMAYTFVHDGLVHRRFPVGPIAYFRRVAAAHQDPKMKKAAPPPSNGHKCGSRKQKEEMAIGEGKHQRVKSLVLLALLGGRNVVASASSTLVFENTCSIPIFPSLIPADGSTKINNSTSLSAIGPNHELSVPLPDGWSGIAIFSTGCISDGLGTRNCTTGNCKGRDCTAEDSPVATGLGISGDSYTMSTDMGYNVGLTVSPMCAGCDCPSASCKAQLESCPHDLRVFNEGTVVACKPGSGLHFSEHQCTIPGDYSTSKVSITCSLKNVAMKIEITC